MELRDFRRWLIENSFDSNELYTEAIKCYQVGAFKAAYLYTYLAHVRYINELIISHRGVPTSYKKNVTDEVVRNTKWSNELKDLKDEDKWEATTYNLLNSNEENGNIFELKARIREIFAEMRRLRNTSAHAKERQVTESTVQELWNNIIYIKPYFIVNGTKEAWLLEFDKLVLYSIGTNTYGNNLKKVSNEFSLFSVDGKKEIFEILLSKYLLNLEWDGEVPVVLAEFLKDYVGEKIGMEGIEKLSNEEKLYISILIGYPQLIPSPVNIIQKLEQMEKKYSFREFCAKYADNFFDLTDYIYESITKEKLVDIIFMYIDHNGKILERVTYSDHFIFNNNDLLLNRIIEKVKHLYYYRMNNTGQKHHITSTFDYSRFNDYKHFIRYIFYCVCNNQELKKNEAIEEFLLRCQKVLASNYTGESFQSDLSIQMWLSELNKEFRLIETNKNTLI